MRGVALIPGSSPGTAITVVAEVGDISRFASPRQLMAYLGLVPSERSSGTSVRRGGITKAGNAQARRVLIEGAWTYRMQARVSRKLLDRLERLPQAVRDIAWKAQLRLCQRYRRLAAARQAQGQWLCRALHPHAEGEPAVGAPPHHHRRAAPGAPRLQGHTYNRTWIVERHAYQTPLPSEPRSSRRSPWRHEPATRCLKTVDRYTRARELAQPSSRQAPPPASASPSCYHCSACWRYFSSTWGLTADMRAGCGKKGRLGGPVVG
jgi:hypothetical protein